MVEFLLSYDREDGDGGYVKVFFDQLADELARRRAGWDKHRVGYLDVKVPTGSRWPDRLSEALGMCRVFLALYSPRYFESEYCGKEWWIFSERVREYETLTLRTPPVPVVSSSGVDLPGRHCARSTPCLGESPWIWFDGGAPCRFLSLVAAFSSSSLAPLVRCSPSIYRFGGTGVKTSIG
ncbi:MAG: TIR domain-containing protein [Pseudonocardiales bacterium]